MANFQWANDPNPLSLTQEFIVPDENKPDFQNVSDLDDAIPTVDMSRDNKTLIGDISDACKNYGFFQLINHGIPTETCHNVLKVITELFELPYEEKVTMLSNEHMEDGKLYKYYITDQVTKEKILMWGEAFFHTWDLMPNANFIERLPLNPPNYREAVRTYITEVAALVTKLLGLISQALGLPENYFKERFGENPERSAQANYYPPCPDPTLTLGLRDHTDIKIITVLVADENKPGLQVLNNDEWFKVDSQPGALIVNVADQLQVLSNDKFKSARHRIVNDRVDKRASFAIFVGPDKHGVVGPIKELLNDDNPALYRDYKFSEFMEEFVKQKGKRRAVKEHFKIDSEASGSST